MKLIIKINILDIKNNNYLNKDKAQSWNIKIKKFQLMTLKILSLNTLFKKPRTNRFLFLSFKKNYISQKLNYIIQKVNI